MRSILAAVVLAAGVSGGAAEAQGPGTVFVPRRGAVIAVPLGSTAPAPPPVPSGISMLPSSEGGVIRIDGLPPGAVLAVDGQPVGGAAEVVGGWIALTPGPHLLEVALPGGGAVRLTVITPVESSGYQVVPRP
jgi:hypothetical protein